jgi:hypothetical protein
MDLNDLTKNPDQLKSLITLLQSMLPSDDSNITSEKQSSPIKTRGRRKTKAGEQSSNKFLQMSEKDMHKDDISVDKKLSKFPPVARSRSFHMIDVTCRVCGRKETISPSLLFEAPERYKCNNCATQAG